MNKRVVIHSEKKTCGNGRRVISKPTVGNVRSYETIYPQEKRKNVSSSPKRKRRDIISSDSNDNYDYVGWREDEVPEYASIPYRDLDDIPQIDSDAYMTAISLR